MHSARGLQREEKGRKASRGCNIEMAEQGSGVGWVEGLMEHRKAIKDGSVIRHWQRLRAQNREARRLEDREKELERERSTPPIPYYHTPFPSHSTLLPATQINMTMSKHKMHAFALK